MPVALDGLNRAQEAAVTHADGPLVVVAGAGHRQDAHRWCTASPGSWTRACRAERILALTFSPPAAADLRERLEALLERPYEELQSRRSARSALRLLQDEALEAGVDPFSRRSRPADRLALLLERIDDLPLRAPRDPRQPRAAPRQLRLADRPAEGGDGLGGRLPGLGRAPAARGRRATPRAPTPSASSSSRGCTRTTTGCSPSAARSTSATSSLRAFRLLHERPHVRERVAARFPLVLADEYQETSFARGHAAAAPEREHRA